MGSRESQMVYEMDFSSELIPIHITARVSLPPSLPLFHLFFLSLFPLPRLKFGLALLFFSLIMNLVLIS